MKLTFDEFAELHYSDMFGIIRLKVSPPLVREPVLALIVYDMLFYVHPCFAKTSITGH